RQVPPAHTALSQSVLAVHARPSAHLVEHDPPQSTSDSVPFLTVSVQLDVHTFVVGSQTPLVHSSAFVQLLPSPHFAHDPPQSTSLSVPFFTESLQVGSGFGGSASKEASAQSSRQATFS